MINFNPYVVAVRESVINRRVLVSKGFKEMPHSPLNFIRRDADLRFNSETRKWVCDVYMLKDGRKSPYKHIENETLSALLRNFI